VNSAARVSGAALPGRQRGIALLTAIMLVALGTILAATIGYQNAMTARRGQAIFAFDQSVLIAEAGEAIAAYALRETRKNDPQHVHLGQYWAMPYGPVEVVPGVMLQAQLEDMQGRFNLNSLVKVDGTIDPDAVAVLQNLLQILGLETKWAAMVADWIDADEVAYGADGAEDGTYLAQIPPYRTPNAQITSPSELLALPGFGRDRYLAIAPYVTALPRTVGINLCTASGNVLDAFGPQGQRQYSLMSPEQLKMERQSGCFPTLTDFNASFNGNAVALGKVQNRIGMLSNYFRLTSVISVGTMRFALYSLLHQEGDLRTRPIQRSYTAD
jgi:general secretion pathway protein K